MGWLALIRLAVIFALFFVALPVWAAKGQSRTNQARLLARSFVWLSFFLHFSIAILGAIRLALPGTVLLLYFLWIAALLLWGRPSLLLGADAWRLRTARLIGRVEELGRRRWMEGRDRAVTRVRAVPGLWFALSSCCLVAHSWYPVHNLRFVELEGYSCSLSLATLCAGQPWKIDPSVPLLAPLVYLSALDAPAVVSLSTPIFATIFALATGLMAFQYGRSRRAAFLAAGLAAVATLSGLMAADGRGTMAAAFAALAVGFAGCSRITAMMAAAIALSISASQGVWTLALTAVVCAIVAAAAARAARFAPVGVRRKLIPVAAVVFVSMICWMTPAVEADGPFQYEAAARMCRRIAGEFARNTWLVVSPTQELPFVYGQGWHLELTEFLASFSRKQVAEASFRFPYPVRDIFFFVEREPLAPDGSRVGERLEYVTHSPDLAVVAYSTALGRAGLQFAAGQLLAEYAKSHSDLKVVYFGERLCVYRAPGALAESR